jgi:hypothetical protein
MGQIACMGELKDVYKTSFRNNGREQSLGKPRSRCVGNSKMNIKEMGCEDRTGFIWLRKSIVAALLNTIMSYSVSLN